MRLGDYRLLGRIGRGSTAEIFLAERGERGVKKRVALKVLFPIFLEGELRDRFIAEAKSVSRIDHPNVAQVYAFFEVDGRYAIEMEYVEGGDLGVLLDGKEPLPHDAAIAILRRVFGGLAAAHREGVIHRDLSPANVLLGFNGDVKLGDFGLAKHPDVRTRTGDLRGNFAYMSPEQARGEKADARSDVFSAALLAYELLTRERAYGDGDEATMLDRARRAEIPNVPPLLARALKKDPTERFQSCEELLESLPQSSIGRDGLASLFRGALPAPVIEKVDDDDVLAPTRVVPGMASPRPRARPWMFMLAPLVVVPMLAVVYFPTKRSPAPTSKRASPQAPVVEPVAVPLPPPPRVPSGVLNVNSKPWAKVYVDGKLVAKETPLRAHRLPIGPHAVELERPDGKRASFTVEIKENETTTKMFEF